MLCLVNSKKKLVKTVTSVLFKVFFDCFQLHTVLALWFCWIGILSVEKKKRIKYGVNSRSNNVLVEMFYYNHFLLVISEFVELLHFILDPHLIMLSVKQGDIKYYFLSLWYDLGLNPGLPDHWRTSNSLGQWPGTKWNTNSLI